MTLKQKLMSLTKDQLIIILQAVLAKMGKKRTFAGLSGPKHIVLHVDGGNWSFKQVDDYHRRKWGFISSLGHGCGYHDFISINGLLTQARADTEEGAHCVQYIPYLRKYYWNRKSIGVCLQNDAIKDPTKEQMKTLERFLDKKCALYGIPKSEIYGHRQFINKECPGDYIFNWLQLYKRS